MSPQRDVSCLINNAKVPSINISYQAEVEVLHDKKEPLVYAHTSFYPGFTEIKFDFIHVFKGFMFQKVCL